MKASNIVPETPERRRFDLTHRRRSSRRSHNSLGERIQVIETPPIHGSLNESRGIRGLIEESPSCGPVVEGLQERANEILLKNAKKRTSRSNAARGDDSPFLIRKKRIPSPTSEQTFMEIVAGTQEMASTRIETPSSEEKVKKWLLQGNQLPSPKTILDSPRRKSNKAKPSSQLRKSVASCEVKENKEVVSSSCSSRASSSPILKDFETSPLILEGVVAFVDVHSDLVECVEKQLKACGADVVPVLNNKVTHLIFKEGSLARYNKAKKLQIHIVSVSWIEACKRKGARVAEEEYPSVSKDKYDSPTGALLIKRQKTRKRLMNLSTEEKYKRYVAKMRRKREKEQINSRKRSLSPVKLVPLDFYNSPKYNEPRSTKSPKQKSVLDQIIECDDGELQFLKTPPSSSRRKSQGSPSCASILGEDFDTPLSLRVAKQFYANKRRSIVNSVTETGASPLLDEKPSTQKNEEMTPSTKNKRKTPEKEKDSNHVLKTETQKKKCLFSQGLLSETPSPSGPADISIKPPALKIPNNNSIDSPVPINVNSARFKNNGGRRSSRRSSMDFVRHINALNRKEQVSHQGRREIVCSSASTDDLLIIQQIIPQFGFYLSKSVSSRTTHVICCSEGATRRTLNVLRGLLRGCWIVSKDWILSSLEEGYLLDEEPYERTDFSPAVQACRLERIAFGSCRSSLLSEMGSIYVSRKSSFSTKDIGDLIRLAGGRISSTQEKADVVIGDDSPHSASKKTVGIKECWLMDTIQHNVVLPLDDYFLNS